MRKTGRAKLEGSPGGRESGSMEEERSRPAKQKICNQTKNNPIFSFSLAEPGASKLRVESIKYPKLAAISLPVN